MADASTKKPKKPRSSRERLPGKEQLSIYLSNPVAERLRIAAVKERRRVSDLAEELIVAGLDKRPTS